MRRSFFKVSPELYVIFAACIWGSAGAFIKWLELPSYTMVSFRVVVPFLVLFPFLQKSQRRVSISTDGPMIIASLLNVLRLYFYVVAFLHTTMCNAIVIYYTKPIIITVMGAIFLKETINTKKIFALVIGFSGVLLMYAGTGFVIDNHCLGMSSMLIAAFMDATVFVIFKKEVNRYTGIQMLYLVCMAGVVVFLPLAVIRGPLPTLPQFVVGCIYGGCIGIVAFIFLFKAMRQLQISTISILSYAEVASAIVFGMIFFEERLTWSLVGGVACIVLASVLVYQER